MRNNERDDLCIKIARLEEKLLSSDKAVELANTNMMSRLATMNEFREQLKEQASRFITRTEHDILIKDIAELREFKAQVEGKASLSSVYIAWGIALCGLLLSIVGMVINWKK